MLRAGSRCGAAAPSSGRCQAAAAIGAPWRAPAHVHAPRRTLAEKLSVPQQHKSATRRRGDGLRAKDASMPSKVQSAVEKVSAQELEVAIADRDRPLVIDFYAAWCGPCVLLSQELEKVARDLGDKVRVLKIDVDENPELSSQLQIQGLPTMIFVGLDKNKPALRTEGLLPAPAIKEIISRDLSS